MLRQECALHQAIIPLLQALLSPLPWASLLSAPSFYLWAEVVEAQSKSLSVKPLIFFCFSIATSQMHWPLSDLRVIWGDGPGVKFGSLILCGWGHFHLPSLQRASSTPRLWLSKSAKVSAVLASLDFNDSVWPLTLVLSDLAFPQSQPQHARDLGFPEGMISSHVIT